jgi:hypothetical protein
MRVSSDFLSISTPVLSTLYRSSEGMPFPKVKLEPEVRPPATPNPIVHSGVSSLYSCMNSRSLQAIACWNLSSRELLGFTDGFCSAVEQQPARLQRGFRVREIFSICNLLEIFFFLFSCQLSNQQPTNHKRERGER